MLPAGETYLIHVQQLIEQSSNQVVWHHGFQVNYKLVKNIHPFHMFTIFVLILEPSIKK